MFRDIGKAHEFAFTEQLARWRNLRMLPHNCHPDRKPSAAHYNIIQTSSVA